MQIYVLLVDHDFTHLRRPARIEIKYPKIQSVYDIKEQARRAHSSILDVEVSNLIVFRVEGDTKLTSTGSWDRVLSETCTNDRDSIKPLGEGDLVEGLELSTSEMLLIQIFDQKNRRQVGTTSEGLGDQLGELKVFKEWKRYERTLGASAKAPSEASKSSEYGKSQADERLVIHDGRRPRDRNVSTIAPPIQMFHPIFDNFTSMIDNPDIQPTAKDLRNARDLMSMLSEICGQENKYSEKLRQKLDHILDARIEVEPNPDNTRPDGVIMMDYFSIRIPCVFIEMKREFGEGGSDPSSQVGLYMRGSWVHDSRQAMREKSCCPTILIAAGGPWLGVMGGIFTDRFIVQRLTDLRWMAVSSVEEDQRIYDNAKILVALRRCIKELQDFYKKLHTLSCPPLIPEQTHPRYFPYPNSFPATNNTSTVFRYLRSLEDDPACVTYLAEITHENGAQCDPYPVVVKFVASYGVVVHEFLANEGWAPKLHCIDDFRKTRPSPKLIQYAPPGLHSNPMRMVVMEYVKAQPPPKDAQEQIEKVLTLLHTNGYVFGDLRPPNILFDEHQKVKFIDFDWCGRYDMTIRDENLPDELQKHIEGNKDHAQVGDGPYAYYPLGMSTRENMWVTGMEALAPIRPIHDWGMMLRKQWNAT